MKLRLDHVVIAVHDLATAMADYTALGFQVLAGGAHPGRESHNALVVFDDGAYLELIAWRAPNHEPWYQTLQAHGEGLVDHALLPTHGADVAALAEAARARGLATLGPLTPGGRLRPDGQQVAWQSLRQTTRALPFVCADVTPRALRVPEGAVRRQANGVTGIAAVLLAVADLAQARQDLQALLGTALQHGLPDGPASAWPELGEPGLACAWAALDGGQLVLVAPQPGAAAGSTAAALQDRLARRGPGPWRLLLRGQPGTPAGTLPAALGHQVVMHIAAA